MGYDLYITRRRDPGDDRPDSTISIEEWQSLVSSDPTLRMDETLGEHTAVWSGPSRYDEPWLRWHAGSIATKYPDDALITKMVEIASELGAVVQGDDGETYDGSGRTVPGTLSDNARQVPPKGFVERLRSMLRRPDYPANAVELPFTVGDRVRDIFGDRNTATVTKIDRKADYGMGHITVRYDDGRIGKQAVIAHGLEPVPTEGDGAS